MRAWLSKSAGIVQSKISRKSKTYFKNKTLTSGPPRWPSAYLSILLYLIKQSDHSRNVNERVRAQLPAPTKRAPEGYSRHHEWVARPATRNHERPGS